MKNIERIISTSADLDQGSMEFFVAGMQTWGKLTPQIIEIIKAYIAMDRDSKDFAQVAMTTWATLNPSPSIAGKPAQTLFLVSQIGK